MPIFTPPLNEEEYPHRLPPYDNLKECGDFTVHFALDPNEKGRNKGKQSDRAAVSELPEAFSGSLSQWIDNLTQTAIAKTNQQAERIADIMRMHNQNEHYESGSTWTLAAFDPVAEHIYLSTLGDSPAYVVMSDGKRQALRVRLNYDGDHNGSHLTNAIGITEGLRQEVKRNGVDLTSIPRKPAFTYKPKASVTEADEDSALVEEDKECEANFVTLSDLRKEAQKHGFDPATLSFDLLVASDGIDPLSARTAMDVAAGEWHDPDTGPNKAKEIIRQTKLHHISMGEEDKGDNLSVIVIPLMKEGKVIGTHPIAACVCDGCKNQGEEIAHSAIGIFQEAVKKLITHGGKAHTSQSPQRWTR